MRPKLQVAIMFIVIFLFQSNMSYSQGVPGPPSFPSNPKQAPIDGGLGLLAIAGGAYAYKKLKSLERE
jgi:hypothetical protein